MGACSFRLDISTCWVKSPLLTDSAACTSFSIGLMNLREVNITNVIATNSATTITPIVILRFRRANLRALETGFSETTMNS